MEEDKDPDEARRPRPPPQRPLMEIEKYPDVESIRRMVALHKKHEAAYHKCLEELAELRRARPVPAPGPSSLVQPTPPITPAPPTAALPPPILNTDAASRPAPAVHTSGSQVAGALFHTSPPQANSIAKEVVAFAIPRSVTVKSASSTTGRKPRPTALHFFDEDETGHAPGPGTAELESSRDVHSWIEQPDFRGGEASSKEQQERASYSRKPEWRAMHIAAKQADQQRREVAPSGPSRPRTPTGPRATHHAPQPPSKPEEVPPPRTSVPLRPGEIASTTYLWNVGGRHREPDEPVPDRERRRRSDGRLRERSPPGRRGPSPPSYRSFRSPRRGGSRARIVGHSPRGRDKQSPPRRRRQSPAALQYRRSLSPPPPREPVAPLSRRGRSPPPPRRPLDPPNWGERPPPTDPRLARLPPPPSVSSMPVQPIKNPSFRAVKAAEEAEKRARRRRKREAIDRELSAGHGPNAENATRGQGEGDDWVRLSDTDEEYEANTQSTKIDRSTAQTRQELEDEEEELGLEDLFPSLPPPPHQADHPAAPATSNATSNRAHTARQRPQQGLVSYRGSEQRESQTADSVASSGASGNVVKSSANSYSGTGSWKGRLKG